MTTTATTPTEGPTTSFADYGVDPEFCEALADGGITSPFPIQELTLPLALSGADVIGQARTGTGKTLAFGLPLLQRIAPGERRTVALVIVPTRELCLQVRDDLAWAAARKDIEVLAVYGGRSIDAQIEALRAGAPVVVGTPGRLLDLQQRGSLKLSGVTALVLDEADEMLDLGFLPDVERLIESTSSQRQTMLFSATMPSAVVALARRYMSKPTFLRADVEENRIAPETRQHFFSCHRLDKPSVLARILQAPARGLCVVFTRTKRMADILATELRDRGIAASPIHSDLRQESREHALKRFREGKIDVLVATEVAARGLDIDDVTHVVNYDCPDDEKMYLHRIGRTGRAGAAGVAITLAVWNELARVEMIKRALDIDEETHEVFSTSEILDDLLDLPPREQRAAPAPDARERSTGRGRGRSGRRGEPAAGRAPARKARSAPTEPQDRAPAATARPARTGPEDRRSRRRVRGRPGDEAGAKRRAELPGAGSPEKQAGAGSPEKQAGAGSPEAPARGGSRAEPRGRPGDEEHGQAQGRRRVRRRVPRDGSDAPSRGGSATPAGSAAAAPASATGTRDGTAGDREKRSRRAAERKDASGRRSGRARGRSRRSASTGQSSQQVDSAVVRGSGRPRLRRPLEVQHLP